MNTRSRTASVEPPRAALPRLRDVIAGKYVIDRELGSGAMSVVYQATHRVTQKRFALKVLLPEVAAHDELAQRFLREAQVASRLPHPHVVEVYDVGVFEGVYYMVMELLEGESLDARLRRQGPLPLAEVTRLLGPCMEALAAAHAAGIVHRDLKPANLFVCRASRAQAEHAKVLDFGISKMAGAPGDPQRSMTRTGLILGTPHYMPLEQMRGQPIDPRDDIYALGVVIYQLLSGRLPHRAGNFGDLVLAMATESPTPLEDAVPDLPAGFAAAVHRAIERAPEDRYPNMQAMLDALRPFLVQPRRTSVPPPPLPPTAAGPQVSGRSALPPSTFGRRWLLAAAAAFGLLLAAAFAATLSFHVPEPPRPKRFEARASQPAEPVPADPPPSDDVPRAKRASPLELPPPSDAPRAELASPLGLPPPVEPAPPLPAARPRPPPAEPRTSDPSRPPRMSPPRPKPTFHAAPPPAPPPPYPAAPGGADFAGRLPDVYEHEF